MGTKKKLTLLSNLFYFTIDILINFIILLTKLHVLNMKKLIYTFTMLAFGLHSIAQQKSTLCGTDEHNKFLQSTNPQLKIEEENFNKNWKSYLQTVNLNDLKKTNKLGKTSTAKYIIPVVVHVIHSGTTSFTNISDAQINSEIDFLNKSFRNLNSDSVNRREIFKDIAADCEIEFRLAKKDPQGNCTKGIVRVYSQNTNLGDDILKRKSVWDSRSYLNIWIVERILKEVSNGIVAGYAQFPFGSSSASTDGVMLDYKYFGQLTPSDNIFNTTTTHEIGHWLGLYHPFQGDSCNNTDNDGLSDTPPTYNPDGARNGPFSASLNTCGTDNPDLVDQQENYMDYFNCKDKCQNMFTYQQKARMHYCIENYRREIYSAENLVKTGVNNVTTTCNAIPSFYSNNTNICAGGSVSFNQNIYNGTATAYNWTFNGGTPSSSSLAVPGNVIYSTPGIYDVKLSITTNGNTVDSTYKNYVTVIDNNATQAKINYADWQYANDWYEKGWRFESENGRAKWTRTVGISYNGIASMKLEDDPFNSVPSSGIEQSFISPSFNLSGATLPTFRFTYAAALVTGPPPSNTKSTDDLRVYQSVNCGTTWTQMSGTGSVFTGTAISTTGLTYLNWATGFVPSDASKWREVSIAAPAVANVRFKITLLRKGGSNFYLDAVRVSSSGGLGINDELANSINFNVAPNPFNTTTELSFELNKSSEVNISVIDILGRNIGTLLKGNTNIGNHIVNLDKNALGLNNGIYFVKVEIGTQSFVKKIMVN
jgi:PKD repeat protein